MIGKFFVGPKGSSVHFVNEDGECSRTIRLAGGSYSTATFEKLRHRGERVAYEEPVFFQIGGVHRVQHPGAFESAANPSFRISPAQRQAKELQRMLTRTEQLAKRTERAMRALQRAKAKPEPKLIEQTQGAESAGEVSAT